MTEQATIEAVPQLGEGFKGEVIAPGDLGYDDARAVWNGSIDRRPALIVRPVGAADVRLPHLQRPARRQRLVVTTAPVHRQPAQRWRA